METNWKKHCQWDFALCSPITFEGLRVGTYKEAYKSWYMTFKRYNFDIVVQTRNIVTQLKFYIHLKAHEFFPTILGRMPNQILDEAESELHVPLPQSLRCFLLSMNGQCSRSIFEGFVNQEYGGDIFISSKNFWNNGEVMSCTPPIVRGHMSLIWWLKNLLMNLHEASFCFVKDPIKAILQGHLRHFKNYHFDGVKLFVSATENEDQDILIHQYNLWCGLQEQYIWDGMTYIVMTKKFTLDVPICYLWLESISTTHTSRAKRFRVSFFDYLY
ncbi:hypothetical protein SELMODRAFT_432295 [Selaginella moellendorffii]|uniref:Knr4/Smi1-like domain-containing protein n=1 Tax=Selaginella moellendorffii TaxID=88036 RepID=D8TFK2_SELML|nr:hypothetical protein SELMODRAFT_432295 [Selaginella moellendorffii]